MKNFMEASEEDFEQKEAKETKGKQDQVFWEDRFGKIPFAFARVTLAGLGL